MPDCYRSWLWNVLEYPWTSNLAQFLAFFSLSMVFLSTITFIISTADELQKGDILKRFICELNIFRWEWKSRVPPGGLSDWTAGQLCHHFLLGWVCHPAHHLSEEHLIWRHLNLTSILFFFSGKLNFWKSQWILWISWQLLPFTYHYY